MKDYICSICYREFKQSSHLAEHMRTHTGERPYRCPYCSTSCITQGNLNAHMITHTGERPHKCKECCKTFLRANLLTRHMKAEHIQAYNELMRIRAADNTKHCPICNRTFSSKQKLKQHQQNINIHGGASTSTATVTMHSQTEPVGKVTAVTQSVTTAFDTTTMSTITFPQGRAMIVTQHLPAATATTVSQTSTEGRTLNTPPPLSLVSCDPDNFFAEDSDPNDISSLIPDFWLD